MGTAKLEPPILMNPSPGSYAMFLAPDMSSVKHFRKALHSSLSENHFHPSDISQIEIAADEALTNSITANVNCQSEETLICRWLIQSRKLTLYIMDYGLGFANMDHPVSETEEIEPSASESSDSACFQDIREYLKSIKDYQDKRKSSTLPFQGSQKTHRNMGKGLKIINSFMDSVKIIFHGENEIYDTPQENKTLGSIVELEFDGNKQH